MVFWRVSRINRTAQDLVYVKKFVGRKYIINGNGFNS